MKHFQKSKLKDVCMLLSNLVSSKVVLTVKLRVVKLSLETRAVLITLHHDITNCVSVSGINTWT